jgi:hypothetical protein
MGRADLAPLPQLGVLIAPAYPFDSMQHSGNMEQPSLPVAQQDKADF